MPATEIGIYSPNFRFYEVCEAYEKYESGVLFPLRLGEMLNSGEYMIVHKLGHGGFATVWMARTSDRLVALKILSADTKGGEEVAIQTQMKADSKLDQSRLLLAARSFKITGFKNKTHVVLASPLQGPNLSNCFTKLSWSTRMHVANELLYALQSLHKAGYIHQDFTPKNAVLGLKSPETLFGYENKYFGAPKKFPLGPGIWRLGEMVAPVDPAFGEYWAQVDTNKVYLTDFGSTFHVSKPKKVKQPSKYRAPEVIQGNVATSASDVWSFGCLLFELLAGAPPFYGDNDRDVLDEIMYTMGNLYSTDPCRVVPEDILFEKLQDYLNSVLTREEIFKVADLFVKIFDTKPAGRPSAGEILQNPIFAWLKIRLGCRN